MSEDVKLGSVNLFVRDMAASLAFFRMLGLQIPAEAIWPDEANAQHIAIDFPNGVSLELDSYDLTRRYDPGFVEPAGGPRSAIIFNVATRAAVDELHDRMAAGGHPSHLGPFDAFWGQRYAVVLDPDGNQVGIMSPQGQAG